jgi:hypothetical protein
LHGKSIMPILGLGLHFIVAIFFAIHAVRSRQNMYWLMILFMFPLLGSIVYLFAVYLPDSRLNGKARRAFNKAAVKAVSVIDPDREVREAKHAYDLAPTAQNQMRLAAALLESGESASAAEHYEACLKGPFATDSEIRLGAARARIANGQSAAAIELLEAIGKDNASYRPEQVGVELARAFGQVGRNVEARSTFESVVSRYGSLESRTEFAIWLLATGDTQTAQVQYSEIQKNMQHWDKTARALNQPMVKRLETAFAKVPR